MKSIFYVVLLVVLLGVQSAYAAWTDDFVSEYDEFGMSVAVESALQNGITPDEILSFIISNSEKFETKKGLKALYCAGADRDAVREAANKLGITVEDVSVALEESIAECGDKVTLSDRDLFDGGSGNDPGLSDRDIELEEVEDVVDLTDEITTPAALNPASPSAP